MKDKMSEKELERLFRQRMNNPEIVYPEGAWEQMEVLLLKDKKRRRFLFWLWFLGVVSALGAMGLYIYHQSTDRGTIDKLAFQIEETENPSAKLSETTADESSEISGALEELAREEKLNLSAQEDLPRNDKKTTAIIAPSSTARPDVATDISDMQSESLNNRGTQSTLSEENDINEEESEQYTGAMSDVERATFTIQKLGKSGIKKLEVEPIVVEPREIVNQAVDPDPSDKWRFGIAFGPEWSSTSSSGYGNKDWSIDTRIMYALTSKLSFFTGLGYISDSYKAGKYDYKPEKGFWTRSIAPQSTSAKCKILDIPLGIGYHFKGINSNGLSVSSALVSQFMATESYYYKYEVSEPDLIKDWMGSGENFHLFSAVNFSLGYRVGLGKGLFMGLHPYINIPLRGVGHGNIKLSSTGFNLGIDF